MNLREAYLYINENKLKDFIKKRCNRITGIKFMSGNTVYCEVLSDNSYCIDMLFGSIKGEIISRYITNEIRLKDKDFYKHQGRKPTTLEWWDECRLID